ncbi:HET-domain-containing protein [Parathielavia appendiculata]|uniref:HET-domain-containing protein n=1 Tax=Parathielavia appendiculata TaxID=2587402 RepID=A0AAN6TSK6_9PEZI|nr:HET-domain-containing protein [Parathielavia appendiculata]
MKRSALCAGSGIKKLFFQLVGDSGHHFSTRTLAHVKEWSTSCNFCRLTLMALNLEPGTPVCPGDVEMLIYFYLRPKARGFRPEYIEQRVNMTHNIQLCFESTEPFAWHSDRSPKLQLLNGRHMSEQIDAEMLIKWLRIRLGHPPNKRTADHNYGVWVITLTKPTEEQLEKPGAIAPEHPQLGRTITDGLRLCKLIDYRYLWVDALCIRQDDEEDLALQVAQMNRIYQFAALTIVQAPADPEASVRTPVRGLLPGLREIRQEQVVVQHEKFF